MGHEQSCKAHVFEHYLYTFEKKTNSDFCSCSELVIV